MSTSIGQTDRPTDRPIGSTQEDIIGEGPAYVRRTLALIRSSHPGPSLVITAMTVLLAVAAGLRSSVIVVFALAVLAGQVSVGWSNDAFDADRDFAGGRTDKPIVAGAVSRRTVVIAAAVALIASVPLAFAVGVTTGFVHLGMTGAAWGYNAGLKSTLASGLMYLIGFGLIPVMAASALPGHPAPRPWTVVAAALLGLGGHFANVLPDLAADRASGVRGLPQRLAASRGGPTAVRVGALVLLLAASVLIVLAPSGPPRWPAVVGLGVAGALATVGAFTSGRVPFVAAIAVAVLNVALFVVGGATLM